MTEPGSVGRDLRYSCRGLAQDLLVGVDAISRLGDVLAGRGSRRAMVICGPRVASESDVVDRVERALGDRLVGRFAGATPHSSVEVLEEATAVAREFEPDTVVSVGGGSVVSIAKGVALLAATERSIYDFEVRFEPPDRVIEPAVPLPEITIEVVAVATTMGCAEIGPSGGGFADKAGGRKVIVHGHGRTSPRTIIFDGHALATTPGDIQRGTTIGQLRVAIESFTSRRHNPIGDALALHCVRRLNNTLARGWDGDVDALLDVKSSCALASLAMVAVGTLGINTAVAHHLGALCGVPHGVANAVMLPHTVRYNAVALPAERAELLAEALGVSTVPIDSKGRADAFAERIAELSAGLMLPGRLRQLGVARDDLPRVAAATLGDRALGTNARPIADVAAVMDLLDQAW